MTGMDENREAFAMRHRGKRASLLAEVLRERWEGLEDDMRGGMDLPSAATALSDQGWINAADVAGITPPSDTTKAITIGLLSAPQLKGLTCR